MAAWAVAGLQVRVGAVDFLALLAYWRRSLMRVAPACPYSVRQRSREHARVRASEFVDLVKLGAGGEIHSPDVRSPVVVVQVLPLEMHTVEVGCTYVHTR